MDKAEEIFSEWATEGWDGLSLSLDEFKKAAEQIREEALEEAAKVCDENFQGFYNTDLALSAKKCAEAIRNLKGGQKIPDRVKNS
jgi:hypothetical protein